MNHLSVWSLFARLTQDGLWCVIKVIWLELAESAVITVAMSVFLHALSASMAGFKPFIRQFCNDRIAVARVTIFLSIPISISPGVSHLTQAIDTLFSMKIKVPFITRTPSPATFLAHTTLRRVLVIGTLGTVVLARLLIDKEITILGAELTLSRPFLAVTQVAWVTRCQTIWVPSTHNDWL